MHDRIAARSGTTTVGHSGFMLLEVIIAFIIAALALGVLYQTAVTGLYSTYTASRYEQAVSRARSRLAMAAHDSPLMPGDWQGDDGGGFSWQLRVRPIATTSIRPVGIITRVGAPSLPTTLYAIDVWISWGDGRSKRSLRMDTEQIGQSPGKEP